MNNSQFKHVVEFLASNSKTFWYQTTSARKKQNRLANSLNMISNTVFDGLSAKTTWVTPGNLARSCENRESSIFWFRAKSSDMKTGSRVVKLALQE